MLRVLWILSLASLTMGARKPPWDEDFEKTLVAWALSDQPFESLLPIYSVPDSESSDYESSSENPCEYDSNCRPDSSTSKASPVAKRGTRDDLNYGLGFAERAGRSHVGGSERGIPGEDFPDFTDLPATSFSCSDHERSGFYADLESRCQVFHECLPKRWNSYLCPVGKIFNQELLGCDDWYNSNCSLAPHYYNLKRDPKSVPTKVITIDDLNRMILTDRARMASIAPYVPIKAIIRKTSDSKSKTSKRTKRHISTTESQDFGQEPQSTTEATVKEAQHSTQSPSCPETIKYIDVEAAVRLIFDRLDNFVKDIIRESKNMAASDAKKSCSTDEIFVSEKKKNKLFPRPLMPPMGEELITSKTDAAVDATANFHKKQVDSRIKRSRLAISPLTKTALIKNYIKLLLKLRKS